MQQTQDPRATVIKNLTEQQQLLEQILKQIPPIEQITFDILIQLFDKCFEIRQQPEFIQALFNKNTIYEEFVQWIVDPIKIIQKRQLNEQAGNDIDWKRKYPYTCMKIAKDNNLFYIHLYLKSYSDQSAIFIWFQFLKQSRPDTLYTSLGYLTDIMMPFIKFEFSDCTKICQQLMDSCDEDALISSSVLQRQETLGRKQRQMISTKKKQSYIEKQISILTLFSDTLISFLLDYIEHESIFKFIHNLILVSLQQTDLKRSKRIFELFLRRALQVQNLEGDADHMSGFDKSPLMDICNEYILQIFKEIYDNANTQKNYRVIFFIDSFIRLNVISLFIERIQQSSLMAKENQQEKLSSSTDFRCIVTEQQTIEYYIKSLTLLVRIYSKMSKTQKTQEEKQRQSKYYGEQVHQNQEQISGGNKVMKQFSNQLNEIFIKLPELSQLVKKNQYRVTPFSSGQNVKPITMCKYQFFELLYNCLLLSKQFPQQFLLDTQKINIFSIIERYLQQNRWNNLAHKVLQKIACLLIMNNKNFFRTKQMNKNNMADQFLNTIIESFTNKKHIFLKSLRFTSQGNLHVLYTIAKAIISKLKQSHTLANFVHQLDYYKKFVMDDLQSYQKRIKQVQYPADQDQLNISNKSADQNDQVKLYVDELSVSEIVKKIDMVNKWPLKQNKRKHGSFIHRSLSYMSDQHHHGTGSSLIQRKKNPPAPSQQILNTDQDEDTDQSSHQKLSATDNGTSRDFIKSQIKDKDMSKSIELSSSFFKQYSKRNGSKLQNSDIKTEGKGLFAPFNNDTKQKIAVQIFGDHAYESKLQALAKSASSRKGNESQSSSQGSPQKPGFFSSAKRKDSKESQQFNINSPREQSNQLLHINILSSDKKLIKNISIEQKTQQELKKSSNVQKGNFMQV